MAQRALDQRLGAGAAVLLQQSFFIGDGLTGSGYALSNAEIARLLGYADSTAFWRAYKAGAGLPPSRDRGGARDPDA